MRRRRIYLGAGAGDGGGGPPPPRGLQLVQSAQNGALVSGAQALAALQLVQSAQNGALVSTVTAPLTPAGQNLSAWWRAYAGALPLAGVASAGASGNAGHTLNTTGADPIVGALNGFGTMVFNGAKSLTSVSAPSVYLPSTGAMTVTVLANVASVPVSGGVPGLFDAGLIYCAGAGASLCGITAGSHAGVPGIYGYIQDSGGTYRTPSAFQPFTLGVWTMFSFRCAGGTGALVNVRINGAPEVASPTGLSAGAIAWGPNVFLGTQYNGSNILNGTIAEVLISPADLGTAGQDAQRAYFNARYGLAL